MHKFTTTVRVDLFSDISTSVIYHFGQHLLTTPHPQKSVQTFYVPRTRNRAPSRQGNKKGQS